MNSTATLVCNSLSIEIAGQQVLAQLDLGFKAGQFWAILGRNGIGKTTVLNTLAALRQPQQGQVLLNQKNIHYTQRKLIARTLGMLQQHTGYVFEATVLQMALTGKQPLETDTWHDCTGLIIMQPDIVFHISTGDSGIQP